MARRRPFGGKGRLDKRQRARIYGLHEAGLSKFDIARKIGCSVNTVRTWLERFAATGSLEDKQRAGRPAKTTRTIMKAIERHMRGKRGASVRKVAAKLRAAGNAVSHMTVARAAHALNLRPYVRPRKPLLSAHHQLQRRRFARVERTRDWTAVVAADEATFYLYDTPNRKHDIVWARRGDPIPLALRAASAVKFAVYGAVCSTGKVRLVVLEENINTTAYIEILANELLPSATAIYGTSDWCYLHDRAPYHSSRKTVEWLDAYVPEHFGTS